MQATMSSALVKLQRAGEELGRALFLYAPALLGGLTLMVMVLWLAVLRHQEPPVVYLDRTAASVLRLWVVLSVIGGLVAWISRKWNGSPRMHWSVHGVARTFLLRGTALLWLFYCLAALVISKAPPEGFTAKHREYLQITLALWLATTLLMLIARVIWHRHRAKRVPTASPSPESVR